MSVVPAFDASELLALWERVGAVPFGERNDALLIAQCGAPPTSLSMRNAALVALRARLFGNAQPLRGNCVRCGAVAEFVIDCAALAGMLLPASDAAQSQLLAIDGHCIEFRVPDIADWREACDAKDFGGAMLGHCVTRCEHDDGTPCAPEELPAPVADALSRRMEELEPGATVGFDLVCPECGTSWTAQMDVGDALWAELQSRAERLLLDIDLLARAYGWSEPQVLALSATRRAAYLQLVGAA
jgi:hypothetical protein